MVENLHYHGVYLLPVIVGLTQLAQRYGVPKRYTPLLSIALGLLATFVYVDVSIKDGILYGIAMGLAASGLYRSYKDVTDRKGKKTPASETNASS